MFEKLLQNIMVFNPISQQKQSHSMDISKRQPLKDQLTNLQLNRVKSIQQEQPKLIVSIWETDTTKQMFDYQNKTVRVKQYKINSDHDIYLSDINKRNTRCIITKAKVPNENTYCGTIEKTKGQFYYLAGPQLQSYRVIGNDQNTQCRLKVGDLIRIGRMRYYLRQLYNGIQKQIKQYKSIQKNKQIKFKSNKSGTCKFCLCDQKDNNDLLISPCTCKGSCAQVHINCLKQWLTNKVLRKSTTYVQFLNYDNFKCQICKNDIPSIFIVDGHSYSMLPQQSNQNFPYLKLEGISNDKSSITNNISIKIIFKQKSQLIVGRGHEADIRLQDVSISRQHCTISYSNNTFALLNKQSKFGTLLKISPGQKINLANTKIQIGRMTLQMTKQPNQQNYFKFDNHNRIKK